MSKIGFFAGLVLLGSCCPMIFAQQTSVTLTTSSGTATLGQNVTLTATVTPSTATGKVTFYDGVKILGIRGASGGQAALTTNLIGAGTHKLRAYYGGGGSYSASSFDAGRLDRENALVHTA